MNGTKVEEARQAGRRAVEVVVALAEAVRASGKRGIPSGHLYEMVMAKVSLDSYQRAIGVLKGAGLVDERYHVLTWTGPELEGGAL